MEETWNGFRRLDFTFEGRSAILVLPEKQDKWGNFAMKTEYWDAFPGTEIALLKEGFALAYLKNANRWATPEDCHVRSAPALCGNCRSATVCGTGACRWG